MRHVSIESNSLRGNISTEISDEDIKMLCKYKGREHGNADVQNIGFMQQRCDATFDTCFAVLALHRRGRSTMGNGAEKHNMKRPGGRFRVPHAEVVR